MSKAILAANRRGRHLAILAGVTVLFVILAAAATVESGGALAPKFAPHPFFPGLQGQINALGDVAIASKSGAFHLHLAQGTWVVPEKGNFPADAAQVRSVAVGMANLEAFEAKTARPDWLSAIGLAPLASGGDGVDVKLSDTSGKAMAELLVGHAQPMPDSEGRTSLYVRRPTENQSWLARGFLAPKPNAADWLDRNVIAIAGDRIKGAAITPAAGPAYTLARDSKTQQDFKLLDLPKGRELSFPGAPDGVAGAISGFTFDDVAKADPADYAHAAQSVTTTFDGLSLTVKVADKGKDHWAIVSAAATDPMRAAEAAAINAKVKDWAFKLSDLKAQQFTATRETLLKPPEAAPTAPGPGPGAAKPAPKARGK